MKLEPELQADRVVALETVSGPGGQRFSTHLLFADRSIDEQPVLDAVCAALGEAGVPVRVPDEVTEALAQRRATGTFRRSLDRVPLLVELGDIRIGIEISHEPDDEDFWTSFRPVSERTRLAVAARKASVSLTDASLTGFRDGDDAAYDRALALTIAAQAIAADVAAPSVVMWHPAGHALDAETFADAIRPLQRQASPLAFWTAVRLLEDETGRPVLTTEGLLPLIGCEIEAPDPGDRCATLGRAALKLAALAIDRGAEIRDGMLLEASRRQKARVRGQLSAVHGDLPVWCLRLEDDALH